MQIIRSPRILQQKIQKLKTNNKTIGFVPTMGALHEGHASLLKRARNNNDICVLSIFVNPKQFGPHEDYDKYPRPVKDDIKMARKCAVDIIFLPSVNSMYPEGFLSYVDIHEMGDALCGKSRPGHFRAVATVVVKLLNTCPADTMYLGQKDAQQAIILKRIVADLNFPTTIEICPTIREQSGLALSSRNQYLSSRQKSEAAYLFRSLKKAQEEVKKGERRASKITDGIAAMIKKETSGRVDYIACVEAQTLKPLKTIKGNVMLALAVKFSKTRLIDNIIFRVS